MCVKRPAKQKIDVIVERVRIIPVAQIQIGAVQKSLNELLLTPGCQIIGIYRLVMAALRVIIIAQHKGNLLHILPLQIDPLNQKSFRLAALLQNLVRGTQIQVQQIVIREIRHRLPKIIGNGLPFLVSIGVKAPLL